MSNNVELINFSAFDIELNEVMKRSELLSYFEKMISLDSNILAMQSFKQDSILNQNHLFSAVFHSWNAFKTNNMISKNLSVEFLLYLSGQRQITKAFEMFGLSDTVKLFSVVIFHQKTLQEDYIAASPLGLICHKTSDLMLSNTLDKRKRLASLFNYSHPNIDSYLLSEEGYSNLENFILTSISNVVFEA